MTRKATSLAALTLRKPGSVTSLSAGEEEERRPPVERGASIKGQTLRLNMEAWRQLKILAVEHARPAHALLVEAVNDLFRKHGKTPVA
jgi:hypothetical protein